MTQRPSSTTTLRVARSYTTSLLREKVILHGDSSVYKDGSVPVMALFLCQRSTRTADVDIGCTAAISSAMHAETLLADGAIAQLRRTRTGMKDVSQCGDDEARVNDAIHSNFYAS